MIKTMKSMELNRKKKNIYIYGKKVAVAWTKPKRMGRKRVVSPKVK